MNFELIKIITIASALILCSLAYAISETRYANRIISKCKRIMEKEQKTLECITISQYEIPEYLNT
jgi:hypothetical protein